MRRWRNPRHEVGASAGHGGRAGQPAQAAVRVQREMSLRWGHAMTPEQLQLMALMRMEIKDLQRQNTLLQRCLAQVSADQAAVWELLRVQGALKKHKTFR